MKLIKENKYKGNVSRKILKSAFSISLAAIIFTTGFGFESEIPANDEGLGYSYAIQIKDKKNYVQSMILKENILPYIECSDEDNKKIDSIISKIDNEVFKAIDSETFRNYLLKNYIDYLISDNKKEITEEQLCSNIESNKSIKFNKEGLDYKVVIDFSETKLENYSYISQSVSNKNLEFFTVNFKDNSIDNSYEYCSYEINKKTGKKDGIKSIVIEQYKSTTKEGTIDNYYKDIKVKLILSNEEEIITTTSLENVEILRKALLDNFDTDYIFDDFIFQNTTVFKDIFTEQSNLFLTQKKVKKIN